MKRRLITLLIAICLIAILVPLTVSAAAPENGWYQEDGYWYYYRDGAIVQDEVLKIGNTYYGFDYEGRMYDNEVFWFDGHYYGATAGGPLCVNQWLQKYGEWFYFGADARAVYDFQQLGGVWYFFDCGRMCHDELVWSIDYQNYYVLSKSGTDSKALTTPGWHQAYGNWYYLYHDGTALNGVWDCVFNIGGVTYGFDYYGRLASNEILELYDYETVSYNLYYINASGVAVTNGWVKLNSKWYYLEDGQAYCGDIYQIGSKWYYFNYDGVMLDIPGPQTVYTDYYGEVEIYVNTDGTLKRNVWCYEKTAPEGAGWTYYDEYCQKVYGPMQIGGKWYYFNEDGIMVTNDVVDTDVGVMVFDKNGYGTPINGWFQHPVTKKWLFAREGHLLTGFQTIGTQAYYFHHNGIMAASTYVYNDYDHNWYAFDANGAMYRTPGWKSVDGGWVYVFDNSGMLYEGWLELGGTWYYLDSPLLITCDTLYNHEDGFWYAFGSDGAGVKMSGNGWLHIGDFRVYQVNGAPADAGWKYIDGAWYYFWYDGEPYSCETYEIDGNLYLFDKDGKMYTKGWLTILNPWSFEVHTYYADANGIARTGLQTIGGKQYFFYGDGSLAHRNVMEVGGTIYWFYADGSVRTTLKAGWNQLGGKWYYCYENNNGDYVLAQNELKEIGGVTYGFGDDCTMCANGVRYAWWDYYMFDANGALLTGWQQFGGKWYYADPDSSDPYIYWEGIYDINGVEYLFRDGYLQSGFWYEYGGFYTANSAGVITGWTPYPDGWTYADGRLIYKQNGESVTGWVGDYYVDNGDVLVNTSIRYNDTIYWLGKDGRYVKSGWINTFGDYMYAKAGGALACNEWLQVGGTWYYFSGITMVSDCYYEIDGQTHRFDASGKWLGQINLNNLPSGNGWKQFEGDWYYFQNNIPVTGMRLISGTWYYFDWDGIMLTNAAASDDDDSLYYYTASGARANYVGWKQIGGKWTYFYQDHSMAIGPMQEGNKIYFFGWLDGAFPYMLTNVGIANQSQLYLVNSSGYSTGPETGTGWRQAGSNWYYIIDGVPVVDRDITIGGKNYAFNYNGEMIVNGFMGYYERSTFYGADGAAVTKAGWYKASNGRWVYVQAGGKVCFYGIYKIGGSDYSFADGYWVE